MRTIRTSIAATVLVISIVTAARATPLDTRPRQPVDIAVASQKPAPSWGYEDGRLGYGWPFSDIVYITITCRGGMADVFIKVRPPRGNAGDKTPITFKSGASEVRHTAILAELDGLSGDYVEFSIPTSDKMFALLIRDGPVVAHVPGASLTLPAQSGRARATTAFRKSCVAS